MEPLATETALPTGVNFRQLILMVHLVLCSPCACVLNGSSQATFNLVHKGYYVYKYMYKNKGTHIQNNI